MVTIASDAYDVANRTIRDLLGDWAAIMRELRRRGVVRTNNNPIGDIAEEIVARHYGGERASFIQPGWDVALRDGTRLQVKALRRTGAGTRRNLSPIRAHAKESDQYDAVAVVIFDEDLRVVEGLRIPRATVEELFAHRKYVNGRIITVTGRLLACPEVERLKLSDACLDEAG